MLARKGCKIVVHSWMRKAQIAAHLPNISVSKTLKSPYIKRSMHLKIIIMNVFGGARTRGGKGPRGPRGFPGKDSSISDFCTWLPNTILKQLQEHEEASYLLNPKNPEEDLKRGQDKTITEWKSRNLQKSNLVAVQPSSEVERVSDENYAIVFHKNLYYSGVNFIESIEKGYGYLCITFKVDGDGEQVLITHPSRPPDRIRQFYEISVTSTEIVISGYLQDKSKQIPIQHNCRNWTTLFLDYTSHDLANTAEFTYILDNDPMMQGSFTLQCPKMTLGRTYIGARKDGTKAFAGALHGLEIYHTQSPKPIPQALKDLIIKTQQIKNDVYGTVQYVT